jgi:hypothetical protein
MLKCVDNVSSCHAKQKALLKITSFFSGIVRLHSGHRMPVGYMAGLRMLVADLKTVLCQPLLPGRKEHILII